MKLRPFSSSWLICLPVMVPASSEDCVSTWPAALPSTMTVLLTLPTTSVVSTRIFSPTRSTSALALYFSKPEAEMVTS